MFVVRCKDSKIIQWNNAMAQVTDAACDDVIGKDFVKDFLYRSAKEKQQAEVFEHILQLGDPELEEMKLVDLRITRKAATSSEPSKHVDLLFSLNRIDSPDGKVLVCVGQDVTELHAFRQVEERKAQILAVVSHELRSPLHCIIGIVAATEKTVTKASQKRQLQLITDCAKRLVEFVSMMVDLSAIKKGSSDFKLKVDTIDILRVLDDVCSLLSSASDKYGRSLVKGTVRLICEYRASRLPAMECDTYRLTQVMVNIIGNALKFTEKGYVRVSTTLKDGDTMVISCEDTGKGIEESALERIFEPFEQEDSSDTRAHAGLGLGLAISREIVRKLGGDIHVVSQPGKGSTFQITLPLRQSELVAKCGGKDPPPLCTEVVAAQQSSLCSTQRSRSTSSAGTDRESRESLLHNASLGSIQEKGIATIQQKDKAAPAVGCKGAAADAFPSASPQALHLGEASPRPDEASPSLFARKKIRLLSVDDDMTNQEVIRAHFRDQKRSFEVLYAMSGKEALDRLIHQVFDVVLLDLMMPEMSGLEVLVTIRRTPGIAEVPVIVLSARGEHDVIADALWRGATDYFTKPLDFAAVFSRIAHIVPVIDSKRRESHSPTDMGKSTASDDMTSGQGHHAALALVFVSECDTTLRELERAITFVERTATVAADRTCRNSDGSLLVLAEGDDCQLRLQGIAHEVERWFSSKSQPGVPSLRVSVGLSGPGDIQTMFIGDQFVATGSVIRSAIRQAWLTSRSGYSNPGTPVDLNKLGPLTAVRNTDSVRSVSTQFEAEMTGMMKLDGRSCSDLVNKEMAEADLAHARVAFRVSQVLRAECEELRIQCEQQKKKLAEYSQLAESSAVPCDSAF
jgi:signal transduction histidine kinase/DNA-binding response OmpR family regulator